MPEMTLHGYQAADIPRIVQQRGTLLAYEPGGGKTPTFIQAGLAAAPAEPWFIVTTRNAKNQIQEELEKWAPGKSNVTVTHYENLERKIQDGINSAYVVIDESDKVRNIETKRFNNLYPICSAPTPRRRVVCATATPVRNGPNDLLSQLILMGIFRLDQYRQLQMNYSDPQLEGFMGSLDARGASNLWELNAVLQTCMIRRTYFDFGIQMPDLDVQAVPVEIDATDYGNEYRAAAQNFSSWFRAARGRREVPSLAAYTTKRRMLELAKLDSITAHIQADLAAGNTLLVFCEFRTPAETLHKRFPGSGLVIGGDPEAEREETIERIQAGGPAVLFATTGSLDSALNIQAANRVYFLGWGWDPATFNQLGHRAWRQNQQRAVSIRHFSLVNDPLESYIKTINRKKEEILEQLNLKPTLSPSNFGLV